MRRALLYRRGGLGDTLLTFPLLEALKGDRYRITAVGNTDYLRLAGVAGWADEVRSEIPEGSFERVIRIGVGGDIEPFPPERMWIPRYYLEKAGYGHFEFSTRLPLEGVSEALRGACVLHPSSGSPKKNPDIELYLELERYLRKKGYRVVALIGEADRHLLGLFGEEFVVDDLYELAVSLKEAVLFVGNDSGFAHLSAYVGVASVIVYGPTDPLVWRPIGDHVYQVSLGLECSPCFPNVCSGRECLNISALLKSLLPLLDHLLVKVNK